jgi:hypothetical protein
MSLVAGHLRAFQLMEGYHYWLLLEQFMVVKNYILIEEKKKHFNFI